MVDYLLTGFKILGGVLLVLFVLGLFMESGEGGNGMSRCVDHQISEGRSTEAAIAICE